MVHAIFLPICLWLIQSVTAQNAFVIESGYRHAMAMDIFRVLDKDKTNKNLIFSPVSIESILTLTFVAAGGQTAKELRNFLKLASLNKAIVARHYNEFLQEYFIQIADTPVLKLATRVFVTKRYTIAPKFNEIARGYFYSGAEQINFADSSAAVQRINTWVESQTENKIQNLLKPNDVGGDTTAVLVNAIYFKGKWAKEFTLVSTPQDFYINAQDTKKVKMISKSDTVKFLYSPELDATGISLPYAKSDLSMLIILPNKKDGLKQLESKLVNRRINLNKLVEQMDSIKLKVYLPKFKIDYSVELNEPLRQLGVRKIFDKDADLSGLYTDGPRQGVSKIQHKAFIDVNELGTEAAAATGVSIILRSAEQTFRADHPFFFAIHDRGSVFFMGHLVNP